MTKILFNTVYKTINQITNSNKLNRPVHIIYGGLMADNSDIETITKILIEILKTDLKIIKYKLKSI